MSAFGPVGDGVVKVVVATNSAESSITLPDVDNVICLGSCKEVSTHATHPAVSLASVQEVCTDFSLCAVAVVVVVVTTIPPFLGFQHLYCIGDGGGGDASFSLQEYGFQHLP